MSLDTKDIKVYNKSLPLAPSPFGLGILACDANGNQSQLNNFAFALLSRVRSVPVGSYIRIRNIESVLVTIRGYLGGRACLVWFSAYNPGTKVRLSFSEIFSNNKYKFFINGSSENDASLYVLSTYETAEDSLSVVSLAGEVPQVDVVSALPSDAVQILGGGVNCYSSINYAILQKGGLRDGIGYEGCRFLPNSYRSVSSTRISRQSAFKTALGERFVGKDCKRHIRYNITRHIQTRECRSTSKRTFTEIQCGTMPEGWSGLVFACNEPRRLSGVCVQKQRNGIQRLAYADLMERKEVAA